MKNDFTYCDAPTIADETQASAINRLVEKKLYIQEYTDVYIEPIRNGSLDCAGEVVNHDGKVIPNVNSCEIYEDFEGKVYDTPVATRNIPCAIYLGVVQICYGHYFTDGLAKMWSLHLPQFQNLIKNHVPCYFVAPYKSLKVIPAIWRKMLDAVGANFEILSINEPMHFDKLYVPDNSLFMRHRTRFYTKEYESTINMLIQSVLRKCSGGGKSYDKIYLSRLKLKHKAKEYGEYAIMKAFKKAGYQVLYPEQMSFEEQVYLYNHAKSLVATKGSLCMNSVFCQPNTNVVILRKSFGTHDYQYVLSQIRSLNVTHVDINLSIFINKNPNLGPFFMYINDNLIKFFKEQLGMSLHNNFSRWRFWIYTLFCVQKEDFRERIIAPEYYYKKMYEELQNHPNPIKTIYRKLLRK